MTTLIAPEWSEYELLDTGDGRRLERFGKYVLDRPDPQILWKRKQTMTLWEKADARFQKGERGKEQWVRKTSLPESWNMSYKSIQSSVKLTPFKHTGVFPEQIAQWEWLEEKVKNQKPNLKNAEKNINILNLFGYTGIASLVCASAGAAVTHVDASFPTIGWARENQKASGLADKPIRWIHDDAGKFVAREIKRGVKYDGILLDPPVYGHGPKGETWDFMKDFPKLLSLCRQVLSDTPLFILINAYAISASALMLQNVLQDTVGSLGGVIESGELALKEKDTDRLLSTGIFGRWSRID